MQRGLSRRTLLLTTPAVAGTAKYRIGDHELADLREWYRRQLFEVVLPFWERHGVDRQYGGFLCALDYDGRLHNSEKALWYQGRGLWVYSYLYNHFGRDSRWLEIASRTRDFLRRFDGEAFWPEVLSRKGDVLQPFRSDVYGMFFVAEGLQEYAWATKDEGDRELAISMLKRLHRFVNRPEFRDRYAPAAGVRVQGIAMVTLQTATQILRRWSDPDIAPIADHALDLIVHKHYNPETGLNPEFIRHDGTLLPEEGRKCLVGHAIQCLWMAMAEALCRRDMALFRLCSERVRRHLEYSWDRRFGSIPEWALAGGVDHQWEPQTLDDGETKVQYKGEFNYYKTSWALNEVLVATMMAWENLRPDWAARYFSLAQRVADEKFFQSRYGSFVLVAGREIKPCRRSLRQDNYHPLRRLMYNLLALQRLEAAKV